ncbi:MAG TPA: hypothetical protein VIF82_13570 [Burkholderiaceae bacterium]
MNKLVMRFTGLMLLMVSFNVKAYEISTHEMLTRAAVNRSVLVVPTPSLPSLMSDLGLSDWGGGTFISSDGLRIFSGVNDKEIIPWGANYEDSQYLTRVFNHFFDPQFNNFAGRPLFKVQNLGVMSPDWALEDYFEWHDICGGVIPCDNRPQDFSFRNGQQNFFSALTASTPALRQQYISATFQTLGMIVHHIQDMAQPQHVRNDGHTHVFTGSWSDWNPNWSFYEVYTQALETTPNLNGETLPTILAQYQYPIPTAFTTARQFWHTAGTSTARFAGMAEFTAQNYTSHGTEYVANQSDPTFVGNAAGFPLPNGSNHDGTAKTIEPENVGVTLMNSTVNVGTVNFVKGYIYDELPNVPAFNTTKQHLAAASVVNPLLSAMHLQERKYVENSIVYDDAQKILLPRAVAFSAGLINHFFRGRLNLVPASNGWIIQNVSQQPMNGVFALYYEDASMTRAFGTNFTGSLSPGQSSAVINYNPPSSATNVIAVFRGQIGAEGNADVSSGWYATAGKVVTNTTSTTTTTSSTTTTTAFVPCNHYATTLRNFVGYGLGAVDGDFQMGSTAGTVAVLFAGSNSSDHVDIYSNNSSYTHLFTLNGTGSMSGTWSTFYYDPSVLHSTSVHIHITGNASTDVWDVDYACPSNSSNPPPPPPPTVSVLFSYDPSPSGYPNCPGYMQFGIDGKTYTNGTTASLTFATSHSFSANFVNQSTGTPGFCGTPQPYYKDESGKHTIWNGPAQGYTVY